MRSKIIIYVAATLLFVNLKPVYSILNILGCSDSRDSRRGGEGQRPICEKVTGIPIVETLANGVLQIPCDLVVCLFNSTCEYECSSKIVGSASTLVQSLLFSGICDKKRNKKNQKLIVCPDAGVLALEKCLGSLATNLLG